MRVDIPVRFQLLFETSLHVAIEEDCTGGLITEVFDDLDKVGTDVVLLHSYLQICMLNPVEGLTEVYKDMVEVLLVLEILPTEDS